MPAPDALLAVEDVAGTAAFYARTVGLRVAGWSPAGARLVDPESGTTVLRLGGGSDGCAQGQDVVPRALAFRYEDRAAFLGAAGQLHRETRGAISVLDHGGLLAVRGHDSERNPVVLTVAADRGDAMLSHLHRPRALDARMVLGHARVPDASVSVGHVHLGVTDLEVALRFWGEAGGHALLAETKGMALLGAPCDTHRVLLSVTANRTRPGLCAVGLPGSPVGRYVDPDGLRVVLS